MSYIPDEIRPYFDAEMERLASVGRVRALQQGVERVGKEYADFTGGVGLKRFVPFTQANADWRVASANKRAKVGAAQAEMRDLRGKARASAAELDGNAEHVSTMRAADRALGGRAIPNDFSPAEKELSQLQAKVRADGEARQDASSRFKTKLGLGAAGAAGLGALYVGTRPPKSQSMGY